jgi:hypothetical protein
MRDDAVHGQSTIIPGPPGRPPIMRAPPVLPIDPHPPVRPLNSGLESGQGFRVDVGELHLISGHAAGITDDLGRAVSGQAGVLADVGPHAGWVVSGALGRCAEAWEQELGAAAGKVRSVGDKLTETAAHYSTVDGSGRDRITSLGRET